MRYIGGVDISADKHNPDVACATLVVLSYPDCTLVYDDTIIVTMDVPYVPSFLAFREVPHILELIRRNTS